MLGIVSLLLIVILALAYLLFLQQKKVQTLTKTLADWQDVHTVKIIKSNLEGRDQESARIAQDWHDGIGNSLSTLRLIVDTIQPKNKAAHTEALTLLEHTQREFRQIIDDEFVHRFTDEAAIRQCLKHWKYQFQLGNINLDYEVDSLFHFDTCKNEFKANLYRITQELLTNVIKHAKAKEVKVEIKEENQQFQLIVGDDGKGWKKEKENASHLHNVKNRVKVLNGTVKIETKENSGTIICVFIPVC